MPKANQFSQVEGPQASPTRRKYRSTKSNGLSSDRDVPFLLEDKLKSLGATFEKADELWGVKVVVDGHLITGQNPKSAKFVGEAILKALKYERMQECLML
ncbi:hypothetical protein MVEN_00280600 [Mycena venus]|uniref:DJ-1/PfpI domain-containing protein n=1 Tax=Mycena venus TaxID=2733690 RepID=A0A8H7DES7_9AGAR|nr:hypothetical protein MVEN_00280600 [Mycena venus]